MEDCRLRTWWAGGQQEKIIPFSRGELSRKVEEIIDWKGGEIMTCKFVCGLHGNGLVANLFSQVVVQKRLFPERQSRVFTRACVGPTQRWIALAINPEWDGDCRPAAHSCREIVEKEN